MSITFSSCFYILKSKFDSQQYIEWMNNFISIVNQFNLVIYTDESSKRWIETKGNPRIKMVVKPIEQFYNYKYKDFFIKNHENNYLLRNRVEWEVNMLWSEKIWFVKETIDNKHFESDFYGWCDIGYFRNSTRDMHTDYLKQWANPNKIVSLTKEKIYYAYVRNDSFIESLKKIVQNKTPAGLPVVPIPPEQYSIAGGFFIIHKDKMDWWSCYYEQKLLLYFNNGYLVKDDQIILVDCILSNQSEFILLQEKSQYDAWFMFQRFLS